MLQVFRKDDYAVKYAVEPLLDGDGPLGDLSVRLKLIYGLGVLNRQEYEDAELLMALREELNHDGNEYTFTDDEILGRSASCTASPRSLRHRSLITATRNSTRCKSCVINRLSVLRWSFP